MVVCLDDERSSDHQRDGDNEASEDLDAAQADGPEEEDDEVSGLMQKPGNAGRPVYDMLLDTCVSALEAYGEEDKKVVAGAMLAHLRRTYTRPVCDQHENLQALEATLVVYGDGGDGRQPLPRQADWAKQWWGILHPHLQPGIYASSSAARADQLSLGGSHAQGAATESDPKNGSASAWTSKLLAIVLAAEEEVWQDKARKEAEALQRASYPADEMLGARTEALLEREALDKVEEEEEDDQAAIMWNQLQMEEAFKKQKEKHDLLLEAQKRQRREWRIGRSGRIGRMAIGGGNEKSQQTPTSLGRMGECIHGEADQAGGGGGGAKVQGVGELGGDELSACGATSEETDGASGGWIHGTLQANRE